MLQVTQDARRGRLQVVNVPDPIARRGSVLIANAHSIISAGTEKAIMDLAKKSLLGKARQRPDHVRRVLQKLQTEGFFTTLQQVFAKLDEPMPMGYCSAGIVLACGAGVQEFKPGDRVASNGPHAGIINVPKHLCASVPENVSLDVAAFTVLGAIALQGIRLARLGLGDTAFVIGLGLVGQIAVALLKAHGCRVIGTDLDADKCALALRMGAESASPQHHASRVTDLTGGRGADAVIIAASTRSNAPVETAAEAVRTKGRIVAIGAVNMDLPRRPLYFKEAEFLVSCAYGPGRYDPNYEEGGHDYPSGHVRWTAQRNMQAVLDLMSLGRIDLAPLITHRFPITEAASAYSLIEKNTEPYLAIALDYPPIEAASSQKRVQLRAERGDGQIGIGCLGAGNFARMVLLPAIRRSKLLCPRLLCSAGGLSAQHAARTLGFEAVTADENEVFADPRIQALFIVTRHDQHSAQVLKALAAGKNVFVEKPLALTVAELAKIEAALAIRASAPLLMVGFNRRFSPAAVEVKQFFATIETPLTVSIRFNAGAIPADHWAQHDETGGGRIVGEACHAIDLATFLTGSLPVRVFAESIGGRSAPAISDDQCFITVRHANGSVSNVAYLAGGDRSFPKERVEVLGGGQLAVIDDFSEVTKCANGRMRRRRAWRQDKGHQAEMDAFAKALTEGGEAPISWDELRAVSLASILAVRSIREGVPLEIPPQLLSDHSQWLDDDSGHEDAS